MSPKFSNKTAAALCVAGATLVLLGYSHHTYPPRGTYEARRAMAAAPQPTVYRILGPAQWYGVNVTMRGECDALPPNVTCEYVNDKTDLDGAVWHVPHHKIPRSAGAREAGMLHVGISVEGAHYYSHVTNPRGRFDAMATYRFDSDIPIPYGLDSLDLQAPPRQGQANAATFLAHNCKPMNNRSEIAAALSHYLTVVTGSRCLSQIEGSGDVLEKRVRKGYDAKQQFMNAYKFHLAFENGREHDYVTEKVYEAFQAGVIPVYLGAPNIAEFLPANSYIEVNENSVAEVGRLLQEIMRNQTLFESYHLWRRRPFPPHLLARLAPMRRYHWTCRVCMWMVAKKRGLNWDRENQLIAY